MVIKMETKILRLKTLHAVADCDSISEHQLEQDHNEKVSPSMCKRLLNSMDLRKEVTTDMLQHFFLPDERILMHKMCTLITYEHYVSDQQSRRQNPN